MKLPRRLSPAPAALLAMLAALASCNKLTDEARPLVGDYYISEISEDEPLYELRDDATCTLRAIRLGVLTYSVDGEWNVYGDSLVVVLDPASIVWEGDSSLIGEVASRYSRRVVACDELTLTVAKDGNTYVYHRRSR